MKKPRTETDWSKHVLTIEKGGVAGMHQLAIPGSSYYRIRFTNTDGVLLITGDLGKWIVNRTFAPEPSGTVSDGYWIGKMDRTKTHIFDSDSAIQQWEEIEKDMDWDDLVESDRDDFSRFMRAIRSCGSEYEYIACVMNDRPCFIDPEDIPDGKVLNGRLPIIFDAFEEICRRMEAISEIGEIAEL